LKKITIINGPNLNLLGKRETSVYGSESFEAFLEKLKSANPDTEITYFQSNIEGELIDAVQKAGFSQDGIIIALGDAIAAIAATVIEVHISNIQAREEFRKISHVSAKVKGTIAGLGLDGYALALDYLKQL